MKIAEKIENEFVGGGEKKEGRGGGRALNYRGINITLVYKQMFMRTNTHKECT